jgi:hypothetical protein
MLGRLSLTVVCVSGDSISSFFVNMYKLLYLEYEEAVFCATLSFMASASVGCHFYR